jgi:hypothetical protein
MSETTPNRYAVFGGTLASDLLFPELPPTDHAPDWTLRTVREAPSLPESLPHLGRDHVQEGVVVDLYRLAGGALRMVYTDTGTFDVSASGREILWYPGEHADDEAARSDVLGRVLAVACHAMGLICLHASAVAFPGGALAFVAPKYHGKSTTAMALAARGGRLITDDTLPVRLGNPPIAVPGVHAVRLWRDSVEKVDDARRLDESDRTKLLISDLPPDRLMRDPSPLRAIYVLTPVAPGDSGPAAERQTMPPLEAALGLLGQTKVGALLGKSEAAVLLDRVVSLSDIVPIFTLSIVRDFDRLHEAVSSIMGWHPGLLRVDADD